MAFWQPQTGSYYIAIQRTSIILSVLAVLPVFFIEENYEAAYSNTKKSMLNKKHLPLLFRKWNKAAWRKICSKYLTLVSTFDSFHNVTFGFLITHDIMLLATYIHKHACSPKQYHPGHIAQQGTTLFRLLEPLCQQASLLLWVLIWICKTIPHF